MEKMTTEHEEIKRWAEKVGAAPSLIDHAEADADMVGIRLDFLGKADEAELPETAVRPQVTWKEFFKLFEEQQLVFVYQDQPEGDDPTAWYRFEKRSQNPEVLKAEVERKFAQEMAR